MNEGLAARSGFRAIAAMEPARSGTTTLAQMPGQGYIPATQDISYDRVLRVGSSGDPLFFVTRSTPRGRDATAGGSGSAAAAHPGREVDFPTAENPALMKCRHLNHALTLNRHWT
jgi:hypothetical protein